MGAGVEHSGKKTRDRRRSWRGAGRAERPEEYHYKYSTYLAPPNPPLPAGPATRAPLLAPRAAAASATGRSAQAARCAHRAPATRRDAMRRAAAPMRRRSRGRRGRVWGAARIPHARLRREAMRQCGLAAGGSAVATNAGAHRIAPFAECSRAVRGRAALAAIGWLRGVRARTPPSDVCTASVWWTDGGRWGGAGSSSGLRMLRKHSARGPLQLAGCLQAGRPYGPWRRPCLTGSARRP
eukprot:scaffold4851_cov428-Prasinococcus_capsulatus_cf.AAC.25